MKTTLLPTLLLAGLLFGSLAPAQAQTTLLKIDYQNATVFHVLDDGRLLLPTGAADGYVLTADSDGYATWQAASGTGGLSVVSSDATLTGQGTAASPLGVTVPLTLTGSEGLGAVQGEHSSGNFGWLGGSNFGVAGGSTSGYGVYGENGSGIGVFGTSNSGYGVYGENGSGIGVFGTSNSGNGVFGQSSSSYGVYGENGSNWGGLGHSNFAGVFNGNVIAFGDMSVSGTLSKGGGSFKIDHPLDPANKYLSHSFVESPDMMNVYNGNAVLDAQGEAVVKLPDYFEALNRDFRYQLTAIGAPGPNLYIAEEISGNTFKVAGGKPGMKVSWLVTGIRQDAWAEQNRIVVEEDKPASEQGFYLHPRLFGQPQERSILQAEVPQDVRTIQEMPPRLETKHPRVPEQQ